MGLFTLIKSNSKNTLEESLQALDKEIAKVVTSTKELKQKKKSEQDIIASLEKELKLKKEKLDVAYFYIEECEANLSQIGTQKSQLTAELDTLNSECKRLENSLHSKKSLKDKDQESINNLKTQIIEKKAAIKQMDQELESKKDSMFHYKSMAEQLLEELKEIETHYLYTQSKYESVLNEYGKVKELHDSTSERVMDGRKELNELKKLIDENERELVRLNQLNESLNQEEREKQHVFSLLKDELLKVDSKRKLLERSIDELKRELSLVETNNKNFELSVVNRRDEVLKKESELNNLEQKLAETKLTFQALSLEESKLKKQEHEITSSFEKVNSQITETQKRIEEYQIRITEIDIELAGVNAEYNFKEQELTRLNTQEISLTRNIDARSLEKNELEVQLRKLNADIEKSTKESEIKKSHLLKTETSIQSLRQQLAEHYESLSDFVQKKNSTSIELESAQQKYVQLFDEVNKVYKDWSDEKSNYEEVEKKLTLVINEVNTLTSKLNALNEDRNSLFKETTEKEQELERKNNRVTILRDDFVRLSSETKKLSQELLLLKNRNADLQIEIDNLTLEVSKLNDIKNDLENKSHDLEKANDSIKLKVENRYEEHRNLIQRINFAKESIAKYDISISQKNEEFDSLGEKLINLENEASVLESAKATLIQTLNSNNTLAENLKKTIEQKSKDLSKAKHINSTLQTDITNLQMTINSCELENAQITELLKDLELKLNELELIKNDLQVNLDKNSKEYSIKNEKTLQLRSALSSKEHEITVIRSEIEGLSNEIQTLTLESSNLEVKISNSIKDAHSLSEEKLTLIEKLETSKQLLHSLTAKSESSLQHKTDISEEVSSLKASIFEITTEIEKYHQLNIELVAKNEDDTALLAELKNSLANAISLKTEKVKALELSELNNKDLEKRILARKSELNEKNIRLKNLNLKIEESDSKNKILNDQITILKNEVLELEEKIKLRQSEDGHVERLKFGLVSSVDELENQKYSLQNRLRTLTAKESDFKSLKQVFEGEKNNLFFEIEGLESQIKSLEFETLSMQKKNDADLQVLKELRKKHAELTDDVQKRKQYIGSLGNDSNTINQEKTKLRKKLAEFTSIDKNVSFEQERLTRDQSIVESEVKLLKSKINEISNIIAFKRDENKIIGDNIARLEDEKRELTILHQDLNQQLKMSNQIKSHGKISQTETLTSKIEELLSQISFNSDLIIKRADDNENTRDFLTSFYTQLPKLLSGFDTITSIVLDCHGRSGSISIKGAVNQSGVDLSKDISSLFKYSRNISITSVKVMADKMTLNYEGQTLTKEV